MVLSSLAQQCLLSCWADTPHVGEPRGFAYRDATQSSLLVTIDFSSQDSKVVELRLQSLSGRLNLHNAPLGNLKRAILAYLAQQYTAERGDDDRFIVLNLPCQGASVPLQFKVADQSTMSTVHNVLALFSREAKCRLTTDHGEGGIEARLSPSLQLACPEEWALQLVMCSRCGTDGVCDCEWRSVHLIGQKDEQRSLRYYIDCNLPQLPGSVQRASSFSLKLQPVGANVDSLRPFQTRVVANSIVSPGIEPPYAIFTLNVRHGDLTWRVARRYRQFAALHACLQKLFPSSLLPFVPPKRWIPLLERRYLLQRQIALTNYLRSLLMIDQVHVSPPLLSFLGALSTTFVDQRLLDSCRREVVHLRVLNYYASPGDILLFHCHGPVTRAQRSMTGSEWDHVALIVPGNTPNSFQLLEATGEGVVPSPMISRILSYSAFQVDYVVIRKLRTPLITQAARNDLLQRFVKQVEGMPYALTFQKIFNSRRTQLPPEDYFCSELVAEAFKAMGVVDCDVTSSRFWPGSFTSGDFVDAELARHGASLDPEVLVDCRLLEVATATRA